MMIRSFAVLLSLLVPACAAPQPLPEPPADEPTAPLPAEPSEAAGEELIPREEWARRYGDLLAAHVSGRSGRVDYRGVAGKREEVSELVNALAPARAFRDERERLAFMLNAYNLLVIANILDHAPIRSTGTARGFFDGDRFAVLGSSLTLAEFRENLIRPCGDPRVHVALCDGAMGSAVLRAEPFDAERLDAQLADQSRRFVNDRTRNAAIGDMALLSPIFEWYAADFAAEPYGSVQGFLRRYADERSSMGRLFKRVSAPESEYQQFNWALNGR